MTCKWKIGFEVVAKRGKHRRCENFKINAYCVMKKWPPISEKPSPETIDGEGIDEDESCGLLKKFFVVAVGF